MTGVSLTPLSSVCFDCSRYNLGGVEQETTNKYIVAILSCLRSLLAIFITYSHSLRADSQNGKFKYLFFAKARRIVESEVVVGLIFYERKISDMKNPNSPIAKINCPTLCPQYSYCCTSLLFSSCA